MIFDVAFVNFREVKVERLDTLCKIRIYFAFKDIKKAGSNSFLGERVISHAASLESTERVGLHLVVEGCDLEGESKRAIVLNVQEVLSRNKVDPKLVDGTVLVARPSCLYVHLAIDFVSQHRVNAHIVCYIHHVHQVYHRIVVAKSFGLSFSITYWHLKRFAIMFNDVDFISACKRPQKSYKSKLFKHLS